MKTRKLPLLLSAMFVLAGCATNGETANDSPASPENDISLATNEETKKYLISFDLKGGTSDSYVSSKTVESLSSSDFFFDCVKNGYSFKGWSYEGNKVFDETGKAISSPAMASSMVFTADWEAISYSITYELNGGSDVSANPRTYTIEDDLVLESPTRDGYTFAGWYSDASFTSLSLSFDGNKTFYAKWAAVTFAITYELNGGANNPNNPVTFTIEDEVTLSEPSKNGYTFDGWYSDSIYKTQVTSISKGTMNDVKVYAKWTPITYSISYELNDGQMDDDVVKSYTVEDTVALPSPTRTGYTFAGWYFDSELENEANFISGGSQGDKTLYAKWSANKYEVKLTYSGVSDENCVGINYSVYHVTDSKVTVVAVPPAGYAFKGWYSDGTFISRNSIYNFTMPAHDYPIEGAFWTTSEEEAWKKSVGATPVVSDDGKSLAYGLYPQSRVTNETTIASLNKLTVKDSNGWYRLDDVYYAKCVASSAATESAPYQFDDGDYIVSGTEYWFKCEPIQWDIIATGDDSYTLITDKLLDVHRYDSSSVIFKDSDIREWLNGGFFNSAFALDSSSINKVTVDNSSSTLYRDVTIEGNEDTEDKVYLLSYKDYINTSYGFDSDYEAFDPARYCLTTDWARANHAHLRYSEDYHNCGYYWTRSPTTSGGAYVSYVDDRGYVYVNRLVNYDDTCIRPAIQISKAS